MSKEDIKNSASENWLDIMEIELPSDGKQQISRQQSNSEETYKSENHKNNKQMDIEFVAQKSPSVSKSSDSNELSSALDKISTVEELKEFVCNFEGCSLKYGAKNTVFSAGNPKAKIMLIGEAPGEREDATGEPFCGDSGKLLDNMLSSIGLSRENNVYITNTVFWRPPANRNPTQAELDICRPMLQKHIALVNPMLIIMVGRVAATSLLDSSVRVSNLRGNYYDYSNIYLQEAIKITAIYHPAYLLRSPQQKKTSWNDLLKINEFIENNIRNKFQSLYH